MTRAMWWGGCGLYAGWEGWRRKVGCREQYQRKSEVFPPVPTMSLGYSGAKFFMHICALYSLAALRSLWFWNLLVNGFKVHLSQTAQPLRTMGTSVWLRGNTALLYKLMPFPWSQTTTAQHREGICTQPSTYGTDGTQPYKCTNYQSIPKYNIF